MSEDKEEIMDELKEEAKKDLDIETGPDMTTQEAGKLGGEMVSRLIDKGEESMNQEEKESEK